MLILNFDRIEGPIGETWGRSAIILRIFLIIRVPNNDDGFEVLNALLLATMMHILSLLIIWFFFFGMVLHLQMCLANFQIDTQICYYQ